MDRLLKCPCCLQGLAQRAAARTIKECVLSMLLLHPFRCQACGHRFLAFRWGRNDRHLRWERRESPRVSVRFFTTLSGKELRGEGMVHDLSAGGCRIETDLKVQVGALLYLQLFLFDDQPPVEVAGTVRSSRYGYLGVKFLRIARDEHLIRQFVRICAQAGQGSATPARRLKG